MPVRYLILTLYYLLISCHYIFRYILTLNYTIMHFLKYMRKKNKICIMIFCAYNLHTALLITLDLWQPLRLRSSTNSISHVTRYTLVIVYFGILFMKLRVYPYIPYEAHDSTSLIPCFIAVLACRYSGFMVIFYISMIWYGMVFLCYAMLFLCYAMRYLKMIWYGMLSYGMVCYTMQFE